MSKKTKRSPETTKQDNTAKTTKQSYSDRLDILIIGEGKEEEGYLKSLGKCRFWSTEFKVKIVSADGIDNIVNTYTDMFRNEQFDLIFIVCDTEKTPEKPYEQYLNVRKDLNNVNPRKRIGDHIVFFANPNTMQIILSHFKDVKLTESSKTANASKIEDCTGVKNYSAKKCGEIFKQITPENSELMLSRIKILPRDYTAVPSSNMYDLFNPLHNGDKDKVRDL
ncbi:MAG: hypothetical protein LUD51_07670 [Clostridia bacterium]|nr:hypothetical protein [Clostridia bacterium]